MHPCKYLELDVSPLKIKKEISPFSILMKKRSAIVFIDSQALPLSLISLN